MGQLSSPLLTTEFIGEHPSDGKKYNSRIILCVVGSAEVQGWNFGGIFIRTPLTLNRINKCLPWPMCSISRARETEYPLLCYWWQDQQPPSLILTTHSDEIIPSRVSDCVRCEIKRWWWCT